MAVLGLHCFAQAFFSCSKRGLNFIAVCGLLIAVASPAVEQIGFRHTDFRVRAHRLSESHSVVVGVTQLCLILCDPMDYTVHGILQARILEWVAVPFSRGSSLPRDRTQVLPHCRWIPYPLGTEAGCHFLLQGIFPTQGLNPRHLCLLHWQADSSAAEPQGRPMYLRGNNCFQSQMYVSNY